MEEILKVKNLLKTYGRVSVGPFSFEIPKGFCIALIGSNGAGKTTLLDMLAGIQVPCQGEIDYFEGIHDIESSKVKNLIGYTADTSYFGDHWDNNYICKLMKYGFDNFDEKKYKNLCKRLHLNQDKVSMKEKIGKMSQGTKMKIMIAATMARDTSLLIMDEPASPLDPVMRDELCQLFREYIVEGERSVLFSTHNIADMEAVTDFAIFVGKGKIMEMGFVDELKEKYRIVRGNATEIESIKGNFIYLHNNKMGFEGLCLKEKAYMQFDAAIEVPSLQELSVMLLKSVMERT